MSRYAVTADWILLSCGVGLALFVASDGIWTAEKRDKLLKKSLTVEYLYATLLAAIVFWMAAEIQTSDLGRNFKVHAFLLVLGYTFVYPLTSFKILLLRRNRKIKMNIPT